MRRFFLTGFERLLNVLTLLAILAVAGLAGWTAYQAQGQTEPLLRALVILLGGLLAVFSVAGCAYLAIGMHDNSRRMIALLERGGGRAPLRATRDDTPRPAPQPDLDIAADDLPPEEPAPAPVPPATRPVFTTRAMPRPQPTEATVQRAPAEPAPPQPVAKPRTPRLVADRRPPR